MRKLIIYVEQYGAFWRLTPAAWRALCEEGLKGNGHNLPERPLRNRPRTIGRTDYGDGDGSYYPKRPDILVYRPLDWEVEDYQEALNELKEKGL